VWDRAKTALLHDARAWGVLAFLSTCCTYGAARADERGANETPAKAGADSVEQARAHFERGVAYYEDGDYRAASLEFQRAYELQHDYRVLYNLGQVATEMRDYAGAERFFRRYLVEGEDAIPAERRAEVTGELTRLKARIGSLRITTNLKGAEIRVDDRLIAQPEAGPVRVSAGRRELVAEKSGYAPVRRVVELLGGDEVSVALIFGPALAEAQGAATPRETRFRPLPWITGIGSAALLLGAGGVGFSAYKDWSDYNAQLDRFTSQGELDQLSARTRTKALIADVLLGAAIAGGAATVILLVSGDSGASVAIDARGVHGRF
jgi:hypothetical protein